MVGRYVFQRGADEVQVYAASREWAYAAGMEEWVAAFGGPMPSDVQMLMAEALPGFEEFEQLHFPVLNPFDSDADYDGAMFDTDGQEYEFVAELAVEHPRRVWTIVDGESNSLVLICGLHHINRIGYIITALPGQGDEQYIL